MKDHNHSPLPLRKQILLAFFTAVLAVPPSSLLAALPTGLDVSYGDITLSGDGHTLNINQLTPQAIANWQSFSIDGDSVVNIQQLDANSVLLNRVMGADPSSLMGQLSANGRVYLINPNGIVVGPDASINTADFIASALDISDTDFLNDGDLSFEGDSAASVVNLGKITAANGDVILIAHQVANQGEIHAPEGVAGLAAGNEVLLLAEGDQRIMVKTALTGDNAEIGVDNSGVIHAAEAELKAAGGNLYELAINQSGYIQATGSEIRNGRVLLTADDGVIGHSGQIIASNVDGSGGEVLIGGDYRGENDAIDNAARTVVTEQAIIDVSAIGADADAGRVVVWADDATRFLGNIYGIGGEQSGNGAFVEVSGKRYLDFAGLADLTATNGEQGNLLLDPASLTIQASGSDSATETSGDPFLFEAESDAGSILLVSTLESQLALSDVTLLSSLDWSETDSSIIVNDAVSWTSGNDLTFESANNIWINADLDAGSGNIVFGLGFVYDGVLMGGGPTLTGDLIVDSAAAIAADTITIRNSSINDIVGNSNFGSMGAIDINGALTVNTLDFQYPESLSDRFGEAGGISGGISIDNAANQIGTITASQSDGMIYDDVVIVDSAGGLTLDGVFNVTGGDVTISTVGDLTLSSGTQLAVSSGYVDGGSDDPTGGDLFLAAQGGAFINQGDASALLADEDGRFLVYSDNPTDTVKGGLVGAPVYNKTFAANTPDTITQSGNRFLYSLAPTLTLTANNLSKTVGEANPTLSYSVSGLVAGDTEADVFSGAPSLSTTADIVSIIGEYTIDLATGTIVLSDYDYGIELVDGILSVEAAALVELLISADDMFRYYGDSNPEFTATFDGLKEGDDKSVVSGLQFSTTANLTSPVGNYTITPFGGSAEAYNISYANGTLTVNPRLLTITALDLEKVYGDALPSFESSVSGLASFDDESDLGTITYSSTASLTNANVGEYAITPFGGINPNYSISYVDGIATVTPRAATITAPTLSREYGLENPTFNAIGSGFLSGEFNRSLVEYNEISVEADVGNYTLTPYGYVDPNYSISYIDGALEITKAPLTLTANDYSREYGLENPTFNYSDSGYRLGQTAADVFSNIQLSSSGAITSSVGNYSIDFDVTQTNENYDVTLTSGNLTITKAPLVVTPALATKVYGEANPDFTVTAYGLRNDDTEAVVTSTYFQVFANEYTDVGSYSLSLLGATAQNYSLSFNSSFLNITPRDLTITADDFTREYGDANPIFTASFDGLASFDDASVISNLILSTSATPSSIALRYGINATYDSNPNYTITFNQGFLTVTKAPLDISLSAVSRFYGDGNSGALSGMTIEEAYGFKLDDDLSDIQLSDLTTTATQFSDVGNYVVNGSIDSEKYEVRTLNPGILTVTPRPFTVLIDMDADERVRSYGDSGIDVSDHLIVGNLVGEDTVESVFEVVDPTQVFTPIGEYNFTGNVIDSNYTLSSFANTSFTIEQLGLDLVFNDATRVYGGDALNLWNYLDTTDVFVAGDTPETVLSTPTAAVSVSSDVGEYPISVSSINSNYTVNSITGGLSITPRPLFVYLNEIERVFGNANPSGYATYRIAGGDNDVLSFDSLDSVLQVHAPEVTADVGSYELTATMLTDNYELLSFEGSMTINPRQISIDLPDSVRRVYGDSNPTLDPFVVLTPSGLANSGLASFHTVSDVISAELPAIDAVPQVLYWSDVFSLNSNYDVDFSEDFQFIIDPRPITLQLSSFSRLYGDQNPDVSLIDLTSSGDSQGLASFDTLESDFTLILPDEYADVGSYQATVSNSNYDITFYGGNVQIDPRVLAVDALNKTSIYGEAFDSFTVSSVDGSDGFAWFDDTLERRTEILIRSDLDASTEVGSYRYVNESFENYIIDLRYGGIFTVNPRPVTISLPGFTRVYGNENPEGSVLAVADTSAYGIASFDSLEDVIDLGVDTPTPQTSVGTYAFDISSDPNYNFSYIGESAYTITQRSLFYRISNVLRNYGDDVAPLQYQELFTSDSSGIASFDTFEDVVHFNVPEVDADVGRYTVTADVNDNYQITLFSPIEGQAPYVQIEPRYLWVDLIGYDRLYGEENVQDEVIITKGSLPSFAELSDVFELFTPSVDTPAGEYVVSRVLDNSNYTVTVNRGDERMTISPRTLTLNLTSDPFGYYGDENFFVDFVIGGDGLASHDNFSDVVSIPLLDALNATSDVGYYLLDSVEVDPTRYTLENFTPSVFTVLPRQLQLSIQDLTLSFDTIDELIAYLSNEDLVVDADVTGLPAGEIMDDAFPIIRYQVVDGDTVPQLPVVPTINNVVIPSASALESDASWIGSGITLESSATAPPSTGVSRTASGINVDGEIQLSKYITVYDGYDTEDNYVLTGVSNGSIHLTIPNTVSDTLSDSYSGTTFTINGEETTLGELNELMDLANQLGNQELTVVSGNQPAPTLDSLFAGGDYDLGIDMMMSLFESIFADGGSLDFEEGSLFYEITRSTSGSLEDLSPFLIQRWFERNADSPDFMAMLAEPLAAYSQAFLDKDPSTYTAGEQQFADLFGEHLGNARDNVAARMAEKRDAWLAAEEAKGSNLADLFGKDVPWSDFMSEAAGEFVSDNLEGKIVGTTLAAGASGAAVAGGVAVLTSFVMPYAFGNVAVGVGTSIAAGTSMVGASAAATVAVPAAIVAGAVVGSVARGIQVFDTADQKAVFDSIQSQVGQDVDPAGFNLTDNEGEDNALNQSILAGALASMLFGE
jgi:filamentous hemagglutinin family protein